MQNDFFNKREDCRLCGSANVSLAVPMAPIPIATPNFDIPNEAKDAPVYRTPVPLELYLCGDCGHLQVLHVGNPVIQYPNYLYRTSSSLGLANHFRSYAAQVIKDRALPSGSFVIDIGSNDGTLLAAFKDAGMRVLGIEPAEEVGSEARERGIDTLTGFFSPDVAGRVRESHGAADLILANNMYANIDDLESFTAGVRDLLADDGLFVVETQYGLDVIEKLLLDTIYHEHLSYFAVKPLQSFFERMGLSVIDVEPVDTKGGSIRVTAQRHGGGHSPSPRVAAAIERENGFGLYDLSMYKAFTDRIGALRDEIVGLVEEQKSAGRSVGGYGCSVGTTTLLAQFGVTDKIDFLFDDDPTKQAMLYGPGYDLPVLTSDDVPEEDPGIIVVFAWRYAEPIMKRNEEYIRRGGKFVVPLPSIEVF